ncbi:MAG: hypothetical protein LC803_11315 [Acidobacteria bacterium]|nr:hypothetical protein [Acidobacteriota bacterium]
MSLITTIEQYFQEPGRAELLQFGAPRLDRCVTSLTFLFFGCENQLSAAR